VSPLFQACASNPFFLFLLSHGRRRQTSPFFPPSKRGRRASPLSHLLLLSRGMAEAFLFPARRTATTCLRKNFAFLRGPGFPTAGIEDPFFLRGITPPFPTLREVDLSLFPTMLRAWAFFPPFLVRKDDEHPYERPSHYRPQTRPKG